MTHTSSVHTEARDQVLSYADLVHRILDRGFGGDEAVRLLTEYLLTTQITRNQAVYLLSMAFMELAGQEGIGSALQVHVG